MRLSEKAAINREMADEWARTIERGDVVRSPSGLLRVVRGVHRTGTRRRQRGTVYSRGVYITFVIRHCSWTHRPYTHLNVGEMVQIGYRPTEAKYTFGPVDAILDSEVSRADEEKRKPVFSCCDVDAMP